MDVREDMDACTAFAESVVSSAVQSGQWESMMKRPALRRALANMMTVGDDYTYEFADSLRRMATEKAFGAPKDDLSGNASQGVWEPVVQGDPTEDQHLALLMWALITIEDLCYAIEAAELPAKHRSKIEMFFWNAL